MNKNKLPRILMGLGVIGLAMVFLFPIWRITLEAAQFPDPLKMYIYVDKIGGDEEEGDILQNINILNHYVGMKYIKPDSIPELVYFPYIAYAMIFLGIIAIAVNRMWYYFSWAGIMSILSALGIYDFYLWMYDYGHDLDPKAPIKVPGQSYMPPLFGEQDLLNFYVTSYPQLGTIGMALCVILAFLPGWVLWKKI
jgi:hypothetical protein